MLKYREIADRLQHHIASGRYNVGDKLPPEKDLCLHYGVSRITVKRAVDSLVAQGLLVKRRGAGTVVKDNSFSLNGDIDNYRQFQGFAQTYPDRKVTSVVFTFDVIHPSAEVAEALQLTEDDFVYNIKRLRLLDDSPVVIEYTQMPILLIPGMKHEILEKSIYNYIENELNLKIQSAHREITAKMPTAEEKKILAMGDDMPIAEVKQVAYLDDGKPFEFSISHHRADRFCFRTVSVH